LLVYPEQILEKRNSDIDELLAERKEGEHGRFGSAALAPAHGLEHGGNGVFG
jgi:hypothetical protein